MTSSFFFTNMRLAGIFTLIGFSLIFATTLHEGSLVMTGLVISIAYFITALYFVMKEYDKDYEKISRMQ